MDEIVARAKKAIAEKVFPGCVIGVINASGKREVLPFGTLDDTTPVCENTIYDLASITKSIPLASLALLFVEQEKFALSDKLSQYLPELQNDFGATIEDLLRYRVKGPRMSMLRYRTFEELRTHIFERGFDDPPGESEYSNLPAFLLGIIIERISNKSLPALADEYLFGPLQMNDTTFFPISPYPHNLTVGKMRGYTNIAPTEVVGSEEIRGIVHDESARLFATRRRAVGHAGLFSTVPDLLNFLEALLHVGHPMSYIAAGAQDGLGWEVNREWMGAERSAKTFGKTGFTGTSVLCDIEKGVGLVILSNRTYPTRPPDNSAINSFRANIADIVLV